METNDAKQGTKMHAYEEPNQIEPTISEKPMPEQSKPKIDGDQKGTSYCYGATSSQWCADDCSWR